jgi:hypothetical protein
MLKRREYYRDKTMGYYDAKAAHIAQSNTKT